MITKEEIHELKTYYTDILYGKVRNEQETDQTYIDDTFKVPEIKTPHHIYRSGLGTRIVDAPSEQIITSNPQVFVNVLKGSKESGEKLGGMLNQEWMPILKRQNPNVFKGFLKSQLSRGEAFYKVVHNESWVTGKQLKVGLPVFLLVLDPMVIYASPEEDENGIPERVIVLYQRQPQDVIVKYPEWSNPKNVGGKKKGTVEWFEYWDKDTRYFEADGVPVLKGEVQPNIYGFTPFVRKYSGFGRRSPDGELASLIVSDIRGSRDLIRQECAMASNIASVMFLYAHKPLTVITSGSVDEDKLRDEFTLGAYAVNLLQGVPTDTKIVPFDIQPSPEMFHHHESIMSQLNQRHPFIMTNFPFGSSGYQQREVYEAAYRRYDSVVDSINDATATAIEMAVKILIAVPGLKEGTSLRKKDLDVDFNCEVELRAKDPLEEDRKITLGDRLWNGGKGSISLKRFHTKFQGMTDDESKQEVASMLADQVTIFNPDVAAVMGMVAAQESGMERWLEQARQEKTETGVRQPLPPTGEERIKGEAKTELGLGMGVSQPRGARIPPERYTRGG